MLRFVVAVSAGGVDLKKQGYNFFDLILYFKEVKDKGSFQRIQFEKRNIILRLVEFLDHPNRRQYLGEKIADNLTRFM